MKISYFALAVFMSAFLASCGQQPEPGQSGTSQDRKAVTRAINDRSPSGDSAAEIHWDTWGVPHIVANDDKDFFFADGWAQMHAHGNTILRLYGQARGRAAEYWGEEFLANDALVHRLGHPDFSETMWEGQAPETKAILQAFARGINAYARAYPESIGIENRRVLPVQPGDINLHALFMFNMRFLAGRELQQGASWTHNGSNAIAIAPSRSESGNALLLQNPHLPWGGEFLWIEKHLLGKDRNIYGASLVGSPGFNIGFNQYLGWTNTVNTIDTADLYSLELAGGGYVLDGKAVPFHESRIALKVRLGNGQMDSRALLVRQSVHGPVINESNGSALAIRISGKSALNAHQQTWRMANANNFEEFEAALRMDQLPYFNVIYADQSGNIFYLFNGHVPRRPHGDWAYWQGIVPGNTSDNLWYEHHGYDELPRLLNPASGWLQNANDPPWTSTLPMELSPDDYPPYMSPRGMEFRPQRAAQMVLEDDAISFEELAAIKHDTRMSLADRLLDDLQSAVDEFGDQRARQAMTVLQNWDRKADNDSRGAVLFLHWALSAVRGGPGFFAVPWSSENPVSTPDGLADPQALAEHLSDVARKMDEQFGRLDVPWGEYNRLQRGTVDLPANGAIGQMGVFRVAAAQPSGGQTQNVIHGDSWVAIIEFGDTPRARVLLSYGNSSQPGSTHNGDQLALFSRKELREAWFTQKQLSGNIAWSEQFDGQGFVRTGDLPQP